MPNICGISLEIVDIPLDQLSINGGDIPPITHFFILLENESYLLQEDGNKFYTELQP